jgi:hypothetical protein
MTSWVEVTYDIVALLGVGLVIYVMQAVEHDRISKVDSLPLQWFRRFAFICSGLALCYSVISPYWQRSLPILVLVAAGVMNLLVNAIALHLRAPPKAGFRMRAHAFGIKPKKPVI